MGIGRRLTAAAAAAQAAVGDAPRPRNASLTLARRPFSGRTRHCTWETSFRYPRTVCKYKTISWYFLIYRTVAALAACH